MTLTCIQIRGATVSAWIRRKRPYSKDAYDIDDFVRASPDAPICFSAGIMICTWMRRSLLANKSLLSGLRLLLKSA